MYLFSSIKGAGGGLWVVQRDKPELSRWISFVYSLNKFHLFVYFSHSAKASEGCGLLPPEARK